MNAPTLSQTDWLTAKSTAKKLGVGPRGLDVRAASLGIRVRLIPGMRFKRFHRGDVSRVVAALEAAEAERVAAACRQPRESLTQTKTRRRP